MTARGYRVPCWALPGELAAFDGGPPGRRTVRDWAVDGALFLFAAQWWFREWLVIVTGSGPDYADLFPAWMFTIDPWVGGVACLALWWRRRYPLALAIAMIPALALSGSSTGAVLVSLFTVAVHRSWLPAVLVTSVQLSQAVVFSLLWQPPGMHQAAFTILITLLFLAPLGWGMVVRFRRQLVVRLRRDAQRERDEHARRLVEARRAERQRIAREMHDVLAHRISLLSVHAGALAYRTAQAGAGAGSPLTGTEVSEAIRVIRDNAHQALTELGEVLSVLRADDAEDEDLARASPPPLLTDLPRLVREARGAGQRVILDLDGVGAQRPALRAQEQRTIYRVVQEGLTNARKHAARAPVTVRVAGSPQTGVDVAVTNPLPAGQATATIPGAGAGLAGLAERLALEGGSLEHGAVGGTFRLAARLPWRS